MATNDETAAVFGESDLISLGEKMATLDLTEPERAALSALISDDDVAGFARFDIFAGVRVGLRSGSGGKRFGVRHPGVRAQGIRADWDDLEGVQKPGRF